uniref:SFRICE_036326 n=1 Tax=Spodoptera frugiperda TaxID=7108 RepID=A0A2H1WBA8_SPOFR
MTHIGGANAVYCTSKKGRHLITVGGYRFSRHRSTGLKTRWHCSTDQPKGCKAELYTVDNTIVKINNNHNHHPKYFREQKISERENAVFSTSKKGGQIIMYGGYRFCRERSKGMKTRWRCSTDQPKGCKAAICTIDNTIVKINNNHNHSPR